MALVENARKLESKKKRRRIPVGVAVNRRSKAEATDQSLSIHNQQLANIRRRKELGVRPYKDGQMNFHLNEDNVTGTRVFHRDAIRYLERLIETDEITHVFVFLVNRLARSTKQEALGLLGLMADHGITIVTRDRVFQTADNTDRKGLYELLFIGEQESADKSVTIKANLLTLARAGYFATSRTPWGTKKVKDGAHRQLRYLRGFQHYLRGLTKDFDAHWDGTSDGRKAFEEAIRRRPRPSWCKRPKLDRALFALINPTYEGYYAYGADRLLRRLRKANRGQILPSDLLLVRKPHMEIRGLKRLRKRIQERLNQLFSRPPAARRNHYPRRLTLDVLIEMDLQGVLEATPDKNVVVVCPRPRCRRQALEIVREGKDAAVRNGGKSFPVGRPGERGFGKRIGTVWLPRYQCRAYPRGRKHDFYIIRPGQIRRFASGCRCMLCGSLNDFEVSLRTDPSAKAFGFNRLWKVRCRRCRAEVYLMPAQWRGWVPFAEFRQKLEKWAREAPRSKYCICRIPLHCNGDCDRAAEHLKAGRPMRWVVVQTGMSQTWVRRIRDRNRIQTGTRVGDRFVNFHELRLCHGMGMSDPDIAKTTGVPQRVILSWRQRAGLRANGRPRPPTYDTAKALRLMALGGSDQQIAAAVGANYHKIRNLRMKFGIPARRAPPT